MANNNLTAAKKTKNDEFYTQFSDIQKEINAYIEYDKDVFKNKTVLLPCDDPEWSNFTKFFALKFKEFGLKKVISTSYAQNSKQFKAGYQSTLFETKDKQYDKEKSVRNGKIFILDKDVTGDGKIDIDDLQWKYLDGDGDFRSAEVAALHDEADIIITNPPFSLFREFLAWVVNSDKQFLMIGSMNAITYKEVFPFIKNNKLWLGHGFNAGNAYFQTPVVKEYAGGVYNPETDLVKFRNCIWFTNIEHGRRHQPFTLMTMADNIKFNKKIDSYPKYDNYDAIEVSFTKAIPSDYKGVMGVPISFLDKYCPEQFEILSANDFRKNSNVPFKQHGLIKDKDGTINGKAKYARILIKHKQL